MIKSKLIIFSAPSGAGKTTIIKNIAPFFSQFEFSISATTRQKRKNEVEGKDYFFLSVDEFEEKIKNNELLEWEEVYDGNYYGTIKSVVDTALSKNKNIIFDVDVIGGLNIKKIYQERALAFFIMPPSIEVLKQRLENRKTETELSINKRLEKGKWEIQFADKFDIIIKNNILENTVNQVINEINAFLINK